MESVKISNFVGFTC